MSQRWAGVALSVITLCYGLATTTIPVAQIESGEAMSAASFPRLLTFLGAAFSALLLWRGVVPETDVLAQIDRRGVLRVCYLVFAAFCYAWLLPWLGFVLGTALLLATALIIMGVRGMRLVLVPAITSVAFWFLLVQLLGLHLPAGRLFL